MIIKKYHSKSPQNQSLYCIQNGDISLNVHNSNNCINANRFYTPRRFTLLCIRRSGYAVHLGLQQPKTLQTKFAEYRKEK